MKWAAERLQSYRSAAYGIPVQSDTDFGATADQKTHRSLDGSVSNCRISNMKNTEETR